MTQNNIWDDTGEQPVTIVRTGGSNELTRNVKRISDPPPRPQPQPLDTARNTEEWTPAVKQRKEGRGIFLRFLGHTRTVLYSVFVLTALGGIGLFVYWILAQYNIQ